MLSPNQQQQQFSPKQKQFDFASINVEEDLLKN